MGVKSLIHDVPLLKAENTWTWWVVFWSPGDDKWSALRLEKWFLVGTFLEIPTAPEDATLLWNSIEQVLLHRNPLELSQCNLMRCSVSVTAHRTRKLLHVLRVPWFTGILNPDMKYKASRNIHGKSWQIRTTTNLFFTKGLFGPNLQVP